MIKNRARSFLATASVLAATGATALLGAGAAHAAGNGGASVSGRDVTVGTGNGTISTSPYSPYWNANYNWAPAWSIQPCGNY